jgi:superoxide dismutase
LKKEFNTVTLGIQGSGWGWLGYNASSKRLELATTANQDPLLNLVPIIGVDIWEHAFYLQYLNVKADVSPFVDLCGESGVLILHEYYLVPHGYLERH